MTWEVRPPVGHTQHGPGEFSLEKHSGHQQSDRSQDGALMGQGGSPRGQAQPARAQAHRRAWNSKAPTFLTAWCWREGARWPPLPGGGLPCSPLLPGHPRQALLLPGACSLPCAMGVKTLHSRFLRLRGVVLRRARHRSVPSRPFLVRDEGHVLPLRAESPPWLTAHGPSIQQAPGSLDRVSVSCARASSGVNSASRLPSRLPSGCAALPRLTLASQGFTCPWSVLVASR